MIFFNSKASTQNQAPSPAQKPPPVLTRSEQARARNRSLSKSPNNSDTGFGNPVSQGRTPWNVHDKWARGGRILRKTFYSVSPCTSVMSGFFFTPLFFSLPGGFFRGMSIFFCKGFCDDLLGEIYSFLDRFLFSFLNTRRCKSYYSALLLLSEAILLWLGLFISMCFFAINNSGIKCEFRSNSKVIFRDNIFRKSICQSLPRWEYGMFVALIDCLIGKVASEKSQSSNQSCRHGLKSLE